MSGLTSLQEVLQNLAVSCDGVEYGFASVQNLELANSEKILGCFKEQEGLTVIAEKSFFEGMQIPFEGPFAKLTIEVHTSLEMNGLTAALAKQLAENDISANVYAAYFHDHIFVQYFKRQQATTALLELRNN